MTNHPNNNGWRIRELTPKVAGGPTHMLLAPGGNVIANLWPDGSMELAIHDNDFRGGERRKPKWLVNPNVSFS